MNSPSGDLFDINREPDRLIGTRIDEYQIEALLGSGGMARVYRAVDMHLNRAVAIKIIDTPYQSDSSYALRFKREAQAIAQLEHPHIVRLYRYGQASGLFYMAMQFIRGANLSDILAIYHQEGGFIDTAEASRIIRQVAEALDYAHSMGVIHRDVKSSNIMLDQHGRAVLTDFGLATFADQAAVDEFGSPHYMAPEQALPGAHIVPQSDLYSLGVVLYEMFTGQRPYTAADPYSLAQKHIHEQPPAPRSLRPELSPQVEQVLLKALDKDPEQRFQSGEELAGQLETALRAAPLGVAPIPAAGLPSVAALVREHFNAAPAASLAAPLRASSTSATPLERDFATLSPSEGLSRTQVSPRYVPPPVTGLPGGYAYAHTASAYPPGSRARRKGSWKAAVIGVLLLLLLCMGAGVLAAYQGLLVDYAGLFGRSAADGPSPTSIFSIFKPTATRQPGSTLPGGGTRQAPSPGVLIPNTGQNPRPSASPTNTQPATTAAPIQSTQAPAATQTALADTQPPAPTSTLPPPMPTLTAIVPPTFTQTIPPPAATATLTLIPPIDTLPPPLPTNTLPPLPTFTLPPPPPTSTVPPPPPPTETLPLPTDTSLPPAPPTSTGGSGQLSIQRRGEDQGWMVITNTGSSAVQVSTMRIAGKKGDLGASAWNADSLPPGGCLLAWKEDRQGNGLPDGISCSQAGSTAWVDREIDGIFKEEIWVFFNDQLAGTCGHNEGYCAVQVQ